MNTRVMSMSRTSRKLKITKHTGATVTAGEWRQENQHHGYQHQYGSEKTDTSQVVCNHEVVAGLLIARCARLCLRNQA